MDPASLANSAKCAVIAFARVLPDDTLPFELSILEVYYYRKMETRNGKITCIAAPMISLLSSS